MKFEPILEVPRYEFEPYLPVVREKIRTWREQSAKDSCKNEAWHAAFPPYRKSDQL
jgi:hypothetical protein